jgi:hypothetical protein
MIVRDTARCCYGAELVDDLRVAATVAVHSAVQQYIVMTL